MNFDEWKLNQNKIYAKFADTDDVIKTGIIPNIKPQQSGYLVLFRHPDSISEKVQEMSEKANKIIPAIVYNKEHVHTTISDYAVVEGDIAPDDSILRNLSRAIQDIKHDIIMPKILYVNWLSNSNTLIAAGMPEFKFLDIAEKCKKSAEKYGIELRLAWGAHITTARYMNKLDPGKQQISELFNLIEQTPELGFSSTEFIDVGYFTLKEDKWSINVYERFKI